MTGQNKRERERERERESQNMKSWAESLESLPVSTKRANNRRQAGVKIV